MLQMLHSLQFSTNIIG